MTIRAALADYLRRARRPSPAALADLADWVERLSPGDPRLVALAALPAYAQDRFRPGEEAEWMVWRYGTGHIAEDRDVWLRDFVTACRATAESTEHRVIDLTDSAKDPP